MSTRDYRGLRLGLLLLVLLTAVTACTPDDVQFLQSFAEDWAKSKNIDPNTPAGLANIAKGALFGTGDPQVDAAIEGGKVAKDIHDADQLANQGLANGDLKKVDQAIQLRPGDFTYRNDRGLVWMTNGDSHTAQGDFAEADKLAEAAGTRAQIVNLQNRLDGLAEIQHHNLVQKNYDSFQRQVCADEKAYATLTGSPRVMRLCVQPH